MVLLAGLFTLPGCVPWPSVSVRSPPCAGVSSDADTQQPIEGARIAIGRSPSTSTVSGSAGNFRLRATYNFHLLCFLGHCAGLWPEGDYSDSLEISHPNYVPLYADAHEYGSAVMNRCDIPLTSLDARPEDARLSKGGYPYRTAGRGASGLSPDRYQGAEGVLSAQAKGQALVGVLGLQSSWHVHFCLDR